MIEGDPDELTVFPPFENTSKHTNKHDSVFDLVFDPSTSIEHGIMAASPFIKSEPNDFGHYDPNTFMPYGNGQSQSHQQHWNQNGNGNGGQNIDPASLTAGPGMSQGYVGSSFITGNNSGIADDELLDLQPSHGPLVNNGVEFDHSMHSFFPPQSSYNNQHAAFSHTPDAPIHSPFNGGSHMAAYRQFGHSLPQNSRVYRNTPHHGDRKLSDSRSPAAPNTPGMNHMQIGDDISHRGMLHIAHGRQTSSVGGAGWDSTPSGHSYNDNSPFPSPNGHPVHVGISEVLKNNQEAMNTNGHAGIGNHKMVSSLPTKMESGTTVDLKRRKRRESHNQVERRRRDNINDRIHDLGGLVPQHRLEDEKVRKHLLTNAPLSPSIANASGMSPPGAVASLLASSHGRTAAGSGNITQGLPIEDKDKGPNKGDILNGSVAWTRDLMWYTDLKLRQEQELKDYILVLGGSWPFQQDDAERRMNSEIREILTKHASHGGFTRYSRAPGSGLRVPGYTNVAGDNINSGDHQAVNGLSEYQQQQATSPGFQSGGSGMSSGQMNHQPHFWDGGEFKEEDEYGMEGL